MKYSIVKNNKLSFTERESLFSLVNEELTANKQYSNSRKEQKIIEFAKKNRFKLSDIGNVKSFPEDSYFLFAKDKKKNILGYICFSYSNLLIDGQYKHILVIKHMYISNSQNHTSLDINMFYILENLFDNAIIYSEIFYRPMSEINGYNKIGKFYYSKENKYIKFTEGFPNIFFLDKKKREKMEGILSDIKIDSDI